MKKQAPMSDDMMKEHKYAVCSNCTCWIPGDMQIHHEDGRVTCKNGKQCAKVKKHVRDYKRQLR